MVAPWPHDVRLTGAKATLIISLQLVPSAHHSAAGQPVRQTLNSRKTKDAEVSNTQINALPFVASSKDGFHFWAVPDSPDFSAGADTGRRMARAYLAWAGQSSAAPPILAEVALAMLKNLPLTEGRQGQLVGFFETVELTKRGLINLTN